MIRIILFFIVVGALSLGLAWLADRPGDVVIVWQGLRIETSLMVLIAAIVALIAVLALAVSLARALVRSPTVLASLLRNRRGVRAYDAISNGLIAIGSGDALAARKFAAEVNRIAPSEPLALLLMAQSAQLSGDRDAAERTFRLMASRPDTKVLGLHGLYTEAQRREDLTGARAYAEEAARTAPSLGWAGKAVLEFRCALGDWPGALERLEQNRGALDKASYRRQRAVMLTARALAAENADPDNAKAFALEAVKLAPTLVPAAALAGRLLAEGGEPRRASRIVAKAWRANPHPDLAQTYAKLRASDAARDQLARIETLAKKTPGNVEGALAVARAALNAREFGKSRAALGPYLSAPTKRVALLMAQLERAEPNDEGRAREWMARALHASPDPQWTADGYVSDRWLPMSPVSGRLDGFEWKVPRATIPGAPVIEPEPLTAKEVEEATQEREPAQAAPESKASPVLSLEASPPSRRPAKPTPSETKAVIPLVHAPDDPGPEQAEDSEFPREARPSGWRKMLP